MFNLAITAATLLLDNLPRLIAAGIDVTSLITGTNTKIKAAQAAGKDIERADLDDLSAKIDAEIAKLQAQVDRDAAEQGGVAQEPTV